MEITVESIWEGFWSLHYFVFNVAAICAFGVGLFCLSELPPRRRHQVDIGPLKISLLLFALGGCVTITPDVLTANPSESLQVSESVLYIYSLGNVLSLLAAPLFLLIFVLRLRRYLLAQQQSEPETD